MKKNKNEHHSSVKLDERLHEDLSFAANTGDINTFQYKSFADKDRSKRLSHNVDIIVDAGLNAIAIHDFNIPSRGARLDYVAHVPVHSTRDALGFDDGRPSRVFFSEYMQGPVLVDRQSKNGKTGKTEKGTVTELTGTRADRAKEIIQKRTIDSSSGQIGNDAVRRANNLTFLKEDAEFEG